GRGHAVRRLRVRDAAARGRAAVEWALRPGRLPAVLLARRHRLSPPDAAPDLRRLRARRADRAVLVRGARLPGAVAQLSAHLLRPISRPIGYLSLYSYTYAL